MSLYEIAKRYWKKDVCITTLRGNTYIGQLIGYTPEEDNEPNPESIYIGISSDIAVELFEHDIESITSMNEHR